MLEGVGGLPMVLLMYIPYRVLCAYGDSDSTRHNGDKTQFLQKKLKMREEKGPQLPGRNKKVLPGTYQVF